MPPLNIRKEARVEAALGKFQMLSDGVDSGFEVRGRDFNFILQIYTQ